MAVTDLPSGRRDLTTGVASLICKVLGVILLLVGILGFFVGNNMLMGFAVNPLHNVVHLITGAILLWAGFTSERVSCVTCWVLGAVYLVVAVLGFARLDAAWRLLNLNRADNFLHLALCIVFLAAAAISQSAATGRHLGRPHPQI